MDLTYSDFHAFADALDKAMDLKSSREYIQTTGNGETKNTGQLTFSVVKLGREVAHISVYVHSDGFSTAMRFTSPGGDYFGPKIEVKGIHTTKHAEVLAVLLKDPGITRGIRIS